jgi:hypothetical protein
MAVAEVHQQPSNVSWALQSTPRARWHLVVGVAAMAVVVLVLVGRNACVLVLLGRKAFVANKML